MDQATMRKRGWSVHSEEEEEERSSKKVKVDTEDDLNNDEKKQLLRSYPAPSDMQMHSDDEEEGEIEGDESKEKRSIRAIDDKKSNDTTATDEQKSNDAANKDDKKNDTPNTDDKKNDNGESLSERLEVAKTKLSKWAARLFDPNRIRGLVEPPQTIPLNDEFLTAFGKREKEIDEKLGRSLHIETAIHEGTEAVNEEDQDNNDIEAVVQEPEATRKVKITNIVFTCTLDQLKAACDAYGVVEHVNLLMDKEKPNLNSGRAYVTYETQQGAQQCVEQLKLLQGRKLNVNLATQTPRRSGKARSLLNASRYWENDITTKCFNCGQVGHMADSCPNPAKLKPCPLCAQTDHEQVRNCPLSRICFRCGVPGHINRDCAYRQNLPKRVVCSICFQSGHYRTMCRRRAHEAPSKDAVCMVCGEKGHFMCKQMKWFFGLEGVSCFNCGRPGHLGYDCQRPNGDICSREEGVAQREIDRAFGESLANELEQQRGRSLQRGRRGPADNRNQDRSRAKSLGPPPLRGGNQRGGRGYQMPSQDSLLNRNKKTPQGNKRRADQRNNNNGNQKRRR